MAIFSAAHLAIVFGILGNIVSFMVYLAPLPTFYGIYKRKSTQGFQSIPYSVALFSSMLYLYYAHLKKHAILLITINTFGSAIETIYLIIFLIYATKEAKIYTTKMLIFFNFTTLGLIITLTTFLSEDKLRVSIVGWICAVFSVMVFVSPLSIMREVIVTKSVEFMPINLSFSLTICAVVWFVYGLTIKDYYIATPNILGFTLGIMQVIMYAIYRNSENQVILPITLEKLSTAKDLTPIDTQLNKDTETNNIKLVGGDEDEDKDKEPATTTTPSSQM